MCQGYPSTNKIKVTLLLMLWGIELICQLDLLYLLQAVDPLCGLHSDLEEAKDPSNNIDNSGRDLRRGMDVDDMSIGVLKHKRFDELSSDVFCQFWGGIVAILARVATVLGHSQIRDL